MIKYNGMKAEKEAGRQLPPGGYVCNIVNVENREGDSKNGHWKALVIRFDIYEGDYAGFFTDNYKNQNPKEGEEKKWKGNIFVSIPLDDNSDNEDRELLLKFAGNIKAGSVTEYGDDGVTQKAIVKTGVANMSEAIVPNPVQLRPFRTFPEVEQPESGFIFRVKNVDNDQVACALFEADGGAWKLKAIDNIKRYLDNELREIEGISILA